MASPSARLARALQQLRVIDATVDRRAAIARDPVQIPRSYPDRRDRELVALVTALMAFGRVETILAKARALLARFGPSPSESLAELSRESVIARLGSFRHRTFPGAELGGVLYAGASLQRATGSVFTPLEHAWARTGSFRDALTALADALCAEGFPAGKRPPGSNLVPDPRGASASKRLVLLARWVVRPDDGVDLGLVTVVPPSALVVPLDVHVHRIARTLGLTRRSSASWLAAEEVTVALRLLDPSDPVRYDFALCHAGVAAHRQRDASHSPTKPSKTARPTNKKSGRGRP